MTAVQPGATGLLGDILRLTPTARVRDGGNAVTVQIAAADLEAVVHKLAAAQGARLADVFASGGHLGSSPPSGLGTAATSTVGALASAGSQDGEPVILRLVWALDHERRYLLLESEVDGGTYAPLSDIAPAAFHEECEIYEQFGIRPASGRPLNRVVLPPHAGREFPRLGRPPAQPPHEVHAPHTVGGQAFEFPFGPVRQAGAESLYYGLVTSGEEVVDLYLFTWHKHRGVEWRTAGRPPAGALFLIERMEGLSAVANGWAFAAAVEAATGAQPSQQAARSRAIALELERLYNHAAAVAALCQSTGLSVGQSAAEIALERLLRVNAASFGHRYLFGVVGIGGARRAPDPEPLRRDLPAAYGELRRAADALLSTNSFMDRLEAAGVLSAAQARRLGLVGPVARGSGLAIDTRHDHPAGPYGTAAPAVVTRESGDVLARFHVMLGEAAESVRMVGQLVSEGAAAGAAAVPGNAGTGLGWAESPRGESLAWVALDDGGRISRARVRPAAVRNWRGFDDACRSHNVFTDIPIIEASFWQTVAGTAR